MKRQILIGALLSIAIAGGAYSAQAETACCRKADVKSEAFQEHCIKGKKRAHKRHFKHMAKVLGLSDLQKEGSTGICVGKGSASRRRTG